MKLMPQLLLRSVTPWVIRYSDVLVVVARTGDGRHAAAQQRTYPPGAERETQQRARCQPDMIQGIARYSA
jgi:hypothetical protein